MQHLSFRIRRGLVFAWLAAGSIIAGSAWAQSAPEWPARPVRMIVPFAPGGASDFVARILQPKLSEALNQQVVVDNRAGASGNIGVEIVARAAPDRPFRRGPSTVATDEAHHRAIRAWYRRPYADAVDQRWITARG